MASSPPKQDSVELLASDDSTKMDEKSIIKYFHSYFKDNTEPPEDFDPSLIDLFLRVMSDPQSDKQLTASYIICMLLDSKRAELIHAILQKGAVDVAVQCIKDAEGLVRENCLLIATRIALHCLDCEKSVARMRVLETIVELMHSGLHFSEQTYSYVIACCRAVVMDHNASVLPKITGPLVTGVAEGMHRFKTNTNIQNSSMAILANLIYRIEIKQHREIAADAMWNEKVIIENIFHAIASGSPSLSDTAYILFQNIISNVRSDQERALLLTGEGYMDKLFDCLDSSFCNVRMRAARVFQIIANSSSTVSLILKNIDCLTQLMYLMHDEDATVQKEVCWVWANLLFSLNNYKPRPEQREEFIRDGIRKIVDFQIEHKADSRLVNQIREVLPKLLLSHSEFMCILQAKEILNMPWDTKKVETETEKDRGESIAFIISEEPETGSD